MPSTRRSVPLSWHRVAPYLLAGAGAWGLIGCDSGRGPVGAPDNAMECPTCECACEDAKPPVVVSDPDSAGEGGDVSGEPPVLPDGDPDGEVATPTGPVPVMPAGTSSELANLVQSANRKMMHDDGKGCLADLNRAAAIEPSYGASLLMIRAQCEMLVGRCQAGKKKIADWYVTETNMSRERAETTAEALGSMRCRGGDSTDRDELLRALYELSDGAYVNKRSSDYCTKRISVIEKLLPKVPPKDPDDGQIRGGGQALFHTGAACFARAGDCAAARTHYGKHFPNTSQGSMTPAQFKDIVDQSFSSSIERCANPKQP